MSSELSLPALLLFARHSEMSPKGSAEMAVRYAMSCSGLSFIALPLLGTGGGGRGGGWISGLPAAEFGAVLPRAPLDVADSDLLFSVLQDWPPDEPETLDMP